MKSQIVAIAILLLGSLTWTSAEAAPGWFRVQVEAAGTNLNGRLVVRLSTVDASNAFQSKWFFGVHDASKEMLATALTGLTSDKFGYIFVDPDEAGVPVIHNFYLLR